jgi:hypothetical protein
MISIFPLNFPFICSNIPAAPAYGVYIYQLYRYSITCGFSQDFPDIRLMLARTLLNQGDIWLSWSHYFESFTMTWLTVMEYLCHKWSRICSSCRKHFPVLSSLMTYHQIYIYINTTVPLVEQELNTFPEHLSSPLVFSGVRVNRSLVLCVCFVDRFLSFYPFLFGHCVVCSSIYGFWFPLRIFKLFLH